MKTLTCSSQVEYFVADIIVCFKELAWWSRQVSIRQSVDFLGRPICVLYNGWHLRMRNQNRVRILVEMVTLTYAQIHMG